MQHSGKLLIKVSAQPYNNLRLGEGVLNIPNYNLEPLFKGYQSTARFRADQRADNWFLGNPLSFVEGNPWDIAHRVASRAKYALYVEPDLLQDLRQKALSSLPVQPTEGLNPHWPPAAPVSPGWHLLPGYTDFRSVSGKGTGVRIAHLDTGYSESHKSKPVNLKPELGWNFYEGNSNTIDPGLFFGNPGHGPATLALLAGAQLPGGMIYGGHKFDHEIGGAPKSEVVPVRIGASVIHLFTSTMAQGIDYALAPAMSPANRCDVISLSHGGLPSEAWAHAVNNVYDAGIVLAAASGDHVIVLGGDVPFHTTIWPSYFRRAITVTGATYDKRPYTTDKWFVLQGSWGPDEIMDKAIASYTPNVAWIKYDTDVDYDMNGGGTSSSTPQIAAACALWLEQNRGKFSPDWRRVQACRYALFNGAYKGANSNPRGTDPYFGNGILNVLDMLAVKVDPKKLRKEKPDTVRSELWQSAMSLAPSATNKDLMHEVEAAQIVCRSSNPEIHNAARDVEQGRQLKAPHRKKLKQLFAQEPDVSLALQKKISAGR